MKNTENGDIQEKSKVISDILDTDLYIIECCDFSEQELTEIFNKAVEYRQTLDQAYKDLQKMGVTRTETWPCQNTAHSMTNADVSTPAPKPEKVDGHAIAAQFNEAAKRKAEGTEPKNEHEGKPGTITSEGFTAKAMKITQRMNVFENRLNRLAESVRLRAVLKQNEKLLKQG